MKTEHILIYRFSAMGDVAMLVPVVHSLAHQYPELRITVLSRPFAKPFFENLAHNVRFMGADVKKDYQHIRGLNRLYRRLSAKQFTCIADMHDVLRTKYLRSMFRLNGYKVAYINKGRKGKKRLTRENNKQLCQQPTSFENYANVLEKLGYPVELNFQGMTLQQLPQQKNNPNLLNIQKENNVKWIGVAPFAAHKGKIYPTELLLKALQLIRKEQPNTYFFFFCGGKNEKEIVSQLCDQLPQSVNASEQLGCLENELIMMKKMDVMISMDSGNMHLASMVGCPVVSVWGATHVFAGFLGWNQSEKNIVQTDLECRPCSIFGNKPCRRGDYACLQNILPSQIAEKTLCILK